MADDAAFQRSNAPAIPETATGRRRLTREDLFAMMEAGVIEEGERTELIDGELFPMASEGEAHIDDVHDLSVAVRTALDGRFFVEARSPLSIQDATQVEPDLAVWPTGIRAHDRFPDRVQLVAEISNTSLNKDLGDKAALYAAAGVPEYWVLDVVERRLWVHRGPDGQSWRERFLLAERRIAPLCAPDAVVELGALLAADQTPRE